MNARRVDGWKSAWERLRESADSNGRNDFAASVI